MSDPLIFATTHEVNEGELQRITDLSKEFSDLVETSDTGLLAFHFHLGADQRTISNVQVHRDAASMEAYLPIVGEKIAAALALSRTLTIDVFGEPGPILQEVLRHNEEQGVHVRVMPTHLHGFTRGVVVAAA
jgi:hypothetical protein